MLVLSDSSTMGVSSGNSDGEGSLEPVDGMAISNLVISANSASKSEAESNSFTNFDPELEVQKEKLSAVKGLNGQHIVDWVG